MAGTTRRQFLKKTAKTPILAGAGVTLEEILGGSVPTLKETRQEVAEIKWYSNPAIPVPKEGCYVGFARLMSSSAFRTQDNIDWIVKSVGEPPATMPIVDFFYGTYDDLLPKEACDIAVKNGIIPLLKYAILPEGGSLKPIDKTISNLAEQIRVLSYPIFFVPFGEANLKPFVSNQVVGTKDSSQTFKQVWTRMHDIFARVGANNNTVWTTEFIAGSYGEGDWFDNYSWYYPGDKYVDWVGFSVYSRTALGHPPQSFSNLFGPTYARVERNQPSKPIILAEFGRSYDKRQPDWIIKAYHTMKDNYPRIKAVVWWDNVFEDRSPRYGMQVDDHTFSSHPESRQAMKEAISDPYFIGTAITK